MELVIHELKELLVAELNTFDQVVNELQDAVDLLGNADYLGAKAVLIKKENLHPDFFVLSSGLAGDILQKFSNYRIKLAVVGDFSEYNSKSLKDFIFESNKLGSILFLSTLDEVFKRFGGE